MRIAFVKYAGLAASGTERWLQEAAAIAAAEFGHEVDYYWCEPANDPVYGNAHAPNDPMRGDFLRGAGVNTIEFHVTQRDLGTKDLVWKGTDFWEKFLANRYDFVQTAKSGSREYPFAYMNTPVVQASTLVDYPDRSRNSCWTFHLSGWALREAARRGGSMERSSVVPIPTYAPAHEEDLRSQLGIPRDSIVVGLHQRVNDGIYSPIPIQAFAQLRRENLAFVMLGGSPRYREQAQQLGLDNVFFLPHSGSGSDISRFLNTLDVYAHGRADGETFGAVIAEALEHGVPAVTHDSPQGANGHRETLGPGGFFTHSPEEYQARLQDLIEDARLRYEIAIRGKEHVETYFSLKAFTASLLEGYRRAGLINGASGAVGGRQAPQQPHRSLFFTEMPRGYLQAGDLQEPGHIVRYALSDYLPEDFDSYIAEFFLAKASTFLDIGANSGLYTPVAALTSPNVRIHAFEPLPTAANDLRATVKLNGWQDRVAVWEVAVSDRPGKAILHELGTGSTLRPEFNDMVSRAAIEVSTCALEEWAEENDIRDVDFIKIDVEGHELPVIRGATNFLARHQPTIFVEVAPKIPGRSFVNVDIRETIAVLRSLDYVLLLSDGKRNLRLMDQGELPVSLGMVLCIPKQRQEELIPPLMQWSSAFPRGSKAYVTRVRLTKILRRVRFAVLENLGPTQRSLGYRLKRIGVLKKR